MPFDLAPELNDNLTVLQLRAQWTLGSQARGESSWSLVMVRFAPIDQPAIVWNLWDTACRGLWVERRPTNWVLNRVLVEDRFPALRPTLEVTLNQPGAGGSPDAWPGQFGPVISWRTHYQGRSYRGRTYWGPGMRDDLEGDFISNDCSSNVEAFRDAMIDTFAVAGMTAVQPVLCIVSRRHNGAPEPIGRFAPVTGTRTVRVMGTQRRRLKWWDL